MPLSLNVLTARHVIIVLCVLLEITMKAVVICLPLTIISAM